MTERIGVEITARDGASRVFAQVASGLDKMEQSFAKADQSASRFSRTGAAIGASLGAVTGVLSNAARAAAEAEVSQTRLQASVEATGALYEEYATQLEAAGDAAVQMAFDDEEAADAISFLTQATGDAQTAINDLGLVMDVARGRGIGLAEAAKIVAAAEQGRFTALRRIGIQLDENATKEEALAALQQKYAGQAEAYAESQAGSYDRAKVQLQNLNEALGEHTGQLQEVLMVLPGLSAGYTAIAAAVGGLLPMLKGLNTGLAGSGLLGAKAGVLGGLALVAYDLYDAAGTNTSRYREDWDELLGQAAQVDATMSRLASNGQANAASVAQSAGAIASDLLAQVDRISELNYLLEQGGTDSQVSAWTGELTELTKTIGNLDLGDNALDFMTDLNSVLGFTGDGAALAYQDLADLVTQFNAGQITAQQFATGVDMVSTSLMGYNALAESGVTATESLTEAQVGLTKGMAAAGDALTYQLGEATKLNDYFTQEIEKGQKALAAQFELTTNAYNGTTNALEAGFRTAVGNTNAIAQQSQAVMDWAENLIAAEGAYSELDKLVAEGRIGGESGVFDDPSQYAAAQRAYNSILKDNEDIQRDILAIQAMQAPTIAAMVDAQQDYLQSVREGSGAEQMRALAYMDSATAAQALQLAQGYLENSDVFGPMIEQSAALSPYLALILEDMGIISRGSQGEITLAGVEDSQSKLDVLTSAIEALTQAQWVASFDGDVTKAEAAYETATGLLVDWDGSEGSADLDVNDNATVTLNSAIALLNEIDGRTATSYVDTVYRSWGAVTTSGGGLSAEAGRLGGVMGYASGGIVNFRAGEAGAEWVSYPGGGGFLAAVDGMYAAPKGSYVHTAPSTALMGGGGPLIGSLHISSNASDPRQVAIDVAREIVPALQQAIRQHERSMGAWS